MNPTENTQQQNRHEDAAMQEALKEGKLGTYQTPQNDEKPDGPTHMPQWLTTVVVIVVVGAGLAYFFGDAAVRFLVGQQEEQAAGLPEELDPVSMWETARAGQYEAAVETYEQILTADPTPDELAFAVTNSLIPRLKTGGVDAYLQGLEETKQIILDESVNMYERAQALNVFAAAYSQSGEDPAVYSAMFSEQPFGQFLIPNDPIASIRNLYTWGYSQYPTAKAGIAIAALYARDVLNNPSLPAETRTAYINETKRYIAEATALTDASGIAEQNPESNRLAGYRVWRAFSIGALARMGEEPYVNQYRGEYQQLEAHFDAIAALETLQYKPFMHWMYATYLLLDGESDERVQIEIDKAVAFYESDPRKEMNEFAQYMRNLKAKGDAIEADFMTREVSALAEISPTFAAFMEQL